MKATAIPRRPDYYEGSRPVFEPIPVTTTPRNPAENLSLDDRRVGGVRSAAQQARDRAGKFAGVRP